MYQLFPFFVFIYRNKGMNHYDAYIKPIEDPLFEPRVGMWDGQPLAVDTHAKSEPDMDEYLYFDEEESIDDQIDSTNASILPILSPSMTPTIIPSYSPSSIPSANPSNSPSSNPTKLPTDSPTKYPSMVPSRIPTFPTNVPTITPSLSPTNIPTMTPSHNPTRKPTSIPSLFPTNNPTSQPSHSPTDNPTRTPSNSPTSIPTYPTLIPTQTPSKIPSNSPTLIPTAETQSPTFQPTQLPTKPPTERTANHVIKIVSPEEFHESAVTNDTNYYVQIQVDDENIYWNFKHGASNKFYKHITIPFQSLVALSKSIISLITENTDNLDPFEVLNRDKLYQFIKELDKSTYDGIVRTLRECLQSKLIRPEFMRWMQDVRDKKTPRNMNKIVKNEDVIAFITRLFFISSTFLVNSLEEYNEKYIRHYSIDNMIDSKLFTKHMKDINTLKLEVYKISIIPHTELFSWYRWFRCDGFTDLMKQLLLNQCGYIFIHNIFTFLIDDNRKNHDKTISINFLITGS